MHVQLTVHDQHIIAFILCMLNVAVLLFFVSGVQINQIVVFIFLISFYQLFIFFKSEILTIHVFQQSKFFCSLVKFLVSQHTILNEYLQIIPFILEFRTFFFENISQSIGYLLGDMTGYFLDISIALQIAARYIQRNVR